MPLFLFLSFFHVLLIRVNMQKKVCSRGAFVVLCRKGKKRSVYVLYLTLKGFRCFSNDGRL